jgi:hypothetical protein
MLANPHSGAPPYPRLGGPPVRPTNHLPDDVLDTHVGHQTVPKEPPGALRDLPTGVGVIHPQLPTTSGITRDERRRTIY